MELPTFDDVRGAADRLAGHARRTPVLIQTRLDDEVSAEIYLKCENFQRIGAFKFRGAWNAISQLDPEARNCGVVTHSSGNHGQAVALTGQLLGIQTTVVMPQDAPVRKREATERYGATVVDYEIGRASCRERV